ncbi:MAG: IS5 family transposase, partial [Bacteroidota bacterium]
AREGLGRSRGGLTTKLHAACDALGNPLRLRVTPGQYGDVPQAAGLVEGLTPEALVADTAYDADWLRRWAVRAGAEAVIPPNPRRALKPGYDLELYRERNRIERFFGRLKLNRRVATRYEKTARNYLSFAYWASTVVLLR